MSEASAKTEFRYPAWERARLFFSPLSGIWMQMRAPVLKLLHRGVRRPKLTWLGEDTFGFTDQSRNLPAFYFSDRSSATT